MPRYPWLLSGQPKTFGFIHDCGKSNCTIPHYIHPRKRYYMPLPLFVLCMTSLSLLPILGHPRLNFG